MNSDIKDISELRRMVDAMRQRIGELEQRTDTLELDQEVLWDDMNERQKRSEMFPQELQTYGDETPGQKLLRELGFGA